MISGLIVGYVVLMTPTILFCFNPRLVRVSFEAGPAGIDRITSAAARDVAAVVEQLGFARLGVKVEKPPLWPTVRELALVADDRRCYASVGIMGSRARLYFYTPFPRGFVLTSSSAFSKIHSTDVAQRSYAGCGPRELLQHHYEALAAFGRGGEVVPTQDARVAATYHYYATAEVRRTLRRTGMSLLAWCAALGCFVLWPRG
jgi:hypothetical protein